MKKENNKLNNLKTELKQAGNKKDKEILQRFFKTKKGEYGEGDIFLGIRVPTQRNIVKKYSDLNIDQIEELLKSPIHEFRLSALLILIKKYENTRHEKIKKEIYKTYISNAKKINNWDLVDISAPKIFGEYLLNERNKKQLFKFANSKNLWEKRISIVSTLTFIKNNQFEETIKIAKIFLNDKEDLIHKSTGWMLREMGKKNKDKLIKFLDENYKIMPRTMLRYSLEKLNEKEKKYYMKK